MNTKEAANQTLIAALITIQFSERYYSYYEQTCHRPPQELIAHEEIIQTLVSTGLDFKFDTREKFFYHREKRDAFQFGLHAAFTSSSAELILVIKTPVGYIGGPFSLLARHAALRHDADFSYSPPYPKLMFSDKQELREVILFGASLFEDAKQAFIASAAYQTSTTA